MTDHQAVPAKRRGRPTKKPLTARIASRVTQAEQDKYIALGGSEWLRKQIAAASIHVEKQEVEVAQHE